MRQNRKPLYVFRYSLNELNEVIRRVYRSGLRPFLHWPCRTRRYKTTNYQAIPEIVCKLSEGSRSRNGNSTYRRRGSCPVRSVHAFLYSLSGIWMDSRWNRHCIVGYAMGVSSTICIVGDSIRHSSSPALPRRLIDPGYPAPLFSLTRILLD